VLILATFPANGLRERRPRGRIRARPEDERGKERFTFLTISPAPKPGPRITAPRYRQLSKERAITEMKDDTLFAQKPSITSLEILRLCKFYRRHLLIFRARAFRATPPSREKFTSESQVADRSGFRRSVWRVDLFFGCD
jgi:hypothetical protein